MSETGLELENRLVKYLFGLPKDKLDSIRGSPKKVLAVIDEFSDNDEFLPNIGPHKGKYIVDKIIETKPKIMIELGGYIGYSAILFASTLDDLAKYYSFEYSKELADIATKIIDLAGLSQKIEVITGKAAQNLPAFEQKLSTARNGSSQIDFIFLDHDNRLYVPDLRVLESLGIVGPGSIIAADNIYYPGAPEYVEYIKSSPEEKREYNYNNENVSDKSYPGRWNILYETEFKEAPLLGRTDTVAITKVVQFLDG